MSVHRGTSNSNTRGSSYDRRRRRAHLIERHGIPRVRDGLRTRVRCHHCLRLMKADGKQWEVDRWPLCGHAGGGYTRDNVVVSCIPCNKKRCNPKARVCPNFKKV